MEFGMYHEETGAHREATCATQALDMWQNIYVCNVAIVRIDHLYPVLKYFSMACLDAAAWRVFVIVLHLVA